MEEERKCDKCKITKPKRLFYRYKYCNRCHIKDYIQGKLSDDKTANHFNLSIDELKNIMNTEININDPSRNEIGEHHRYDEIIGYYIGIYRQSTIITDDVINNFLDEII